MTLESALASNSTQAFEISHWIAHVESTVHALSLRKKRQFSWNNLSVKILHNERIENARKKKKQISKMMVQNACFILWKKFSEKYLLHERLSIFNQYRAMLDSIIIQRRSIIRKTWQYLSAKEINAYKTLTRNQKWHEFAVGLRVLSIKINHDTIESSKAATEKQIVNLWSKYCDRLIGRYHRIQTPKMIRALLVIEKFVNSSLTPYRTKNVYSKYSIPLELPQPDIKTALERINRFAKIWLRRRCSAFAHAYVDETYGTCFVHVVRKLKR